MHIYSHSGAVIDWLEAFGAASLLIAEEKKGELENERTLIISEKPMEDEAPVHLFTPGTLKQTLDAALLLAKKIGYLQPAMDRVMALEAELAELHQLIGLTRSTAPDTLPRVLLLEALDPPRAGGRWIPDVVNQAGGQPLGPLPGAPSLLMAWEEVERLHPNWVVVMQAGLSPQESAQGFREQVPAGIRASLPAVQIACIDGKRGFERNGPQLYTLIGLLAGLFYPQAQQHRSEHDMVMLNG